MTSVKHAFRFTLVTAALLLALLACQNTLSGTGDGWDPNLGRLTVRINNAVQATSTIAPDLAMVIDQYAIVLTGPNAEEITATLSGSATSRSFSNLPPGEWRITAEGWAQEAALIFTIP